MSHLETHIEICSEMEQNSQIIELTNEQLETVSGGAVKKRRRRRRRRGFPLFPLPYGRDAASAATIAGFVI